MLSVAWHFWAGNIALVQPNVQRIGRDLPIQQDETVAPGTRNPARITNEGGRQNEPMCATCPRAGTMAG